MKVVKAGWGAAVEKKLKQNWTTKEQGNDGWKPTLFLASKKTFFQKPVDSLPVCDKNSRFNVLGNNS
jgi:hypothetical protein